MGVLHGNRDRVEPPGPNLVKSRDPLAEPIVTSRVLLTKHVAKAQHPIVTPPSRRKCKQGSVGVRRILVPRDSGGASTGFWWCILSDKRSRY